MKIVVLFKKSFVSLYILTHVIRSSCSTLSISQSLDSDAPPWAAGSSVLKTDLLTPVFFLPEKIHFYFRSKLQQGWKWKRKTTTKIRIKSRIIMPWWMKVRWNSWLCMGKQPSLLLEGICADRRNILRQYIYINNIWPSLSALGKRRNLHYRSSLQLSQCPWFLTGYGLVMAATVFGFFTYYFLIVYHPDGKQSYLWGRHYTNNT